MHIHHDGDTCITLLHRRCCLQHSISAHIACDVALLAASQFCSHLSQARLAVRVVVQVTVILEHMFHPSEMEEEATLREDLEDDIKTECTKMGPVEKVA